MGHQTLIYGAIEVHPSSPHRPDADARTARALEALPEAGEWPFLVRSMFGLTASGQVTVAYRCRVLHFGASLKAVEWDWAEWLGKFERLLSGLDGIRATVHLQTELVGDHTYVWLRTNDAPADWPPVWTFQGGMRSF